MTNVILHQRFPSVLILSVEGSNVESSIGSAEELMLFGKSHHVWNLAFVRHLCLFCRYGGRHCLEELMMKKGEGFDTNEAEIITQIC